MFRKWLPVLLLFAYMAPAQALDPNAQLQNKPRAVGTVLDRIKETESAWDQPQSKKISSAKRWVSRVSAVSQPQTPAMVSWAFPVSKQAGFKQDKLVDANDRDTVRRYRHPTSRKHH